MSLAAGVWGVTLDTDRGIIGRVSSRTSTKACLGMKLRQNGVHLLQNAESQAITRRLLKWYRQSGRSLPWRVARDEKANPYRVLVSEIMLQQTQVATVIPYFHRFLDAFPTLEKLAASDEQDVLHLWQGLGYYRRARLLHATAKAVVERHDGELPGSYQELRDLPGVGDYTAAALASIAFDRPHAVVDGNVARVMARLFRIHEPVNTTTGKRAIQQAANALMQDVAEQGESPSDWNQAVMELGALVCSPKSPTCLVCPLKDHCQANEHGEVETLPNKLPKKKPVTVTHTVVLIERRGQFLVEQRGDDGLWAGMWQLITFEPPGSRKLSQSALQNQVHKHTGLDIADVTSLIQFNHQITHRTIAFEVYHAAMSSGRKRQALRWASLDEIMQLPMSNPQRRIVKALKKNTDESI